LRTTHTLSSRPKRRDLQLPFEGPRPTQKTCHPERSEGPAFLRTTYTLSSRPKRRDLQLPFEGPRPTQKTCHPERSEGPAFLRTTYTLSSRPKWRDLQLPFEGRRPGVIRAPKDFLVNPPNLLKTPKTPIDTDDNFPKNLAYLPPPNHYH
jgi:hypothetical protein